MWPLHIPVNNHTLAAWLLICYSKPCPFSLPTHPPYTDCPLSKQEHLNRPVSIWSEYNWLCLGVEEQHPPLHLSQNPLFPLHFSHFAPPHPSHPALWPLSSELCVYMCLFGSMAVTALGHQRTSSGSWTPCRLSSGTCTGPRRNLPNTLRVASSSCRATWSRTVSNGVYDCVCVCVWEEGMTVTEILMLILCLNISLALQHQDGVWVQADKEQQVHRFPHFSNIMHHVQCHGWRQGPIS